MLELEHLAAILTRKLHVDIPGLQQVVLAAVLEAHRRSDIPGQRAEHVVVGIIDALAHRGTPVEDYVDSRARQSWERDLRTAYLEAFRRASRPDTIY